MITVGLLQKKLDKRFGGALQAGSHCEGGEACVQELLACCLEIPWTDSPIATRTWDLRPINDIVVDVSVRTKYMIPLAAAYAGSMDWPTERQGSVVEKITILTFNRIIAELPGLPKSLIMDCRNADTFSKTHEASAAAAAAAASSAAAAASSEAAAYAAYAAAVYTMAAYTMAASAAAASAAYAAASVDYTKSEKVFITTCNLWLEAAQ